MGIAVARLRPRIDDETAERASRGSRAPLRIACVDARGMETHRDAWSDLSARALEPNVFFEADFLLALIDALDEAAKPLFLLAWDVDDASRSRLTALLPLHVMRRRGTLIARGFRHDLTTLGTPLVDRERGVEAFAALLVWLTSIGAAPCALALADVPAEGPFWTAVKAMRTHSTRELVARDRAVLFAGRPAGASRKRVKELARLRRRLAERGRLTFASATSAEAVAEGVERFLALEVSGWKGRRGGALACDPGRESFARAMASGMADRGACRIDAAFDPLLVVEVSGSEGDGYDAWTVAYLRAGLSPLSFELVRWTVVRRRLGGDRHVVGFQIRGRRGRASSPIRAFDRATATATTSSGNRYVLIGAPSEAGLEDSVVVAWLARHDLTRHDFETIGMEDL